MDEQLKSLVARRGQLKGQATRFANYLLDSGLQHDRWELQERVAKLKEKWYEFERTQSAIELLDDSEAQALLDSASQSNFISLEVFKKLNLPATNVNLPVCGISQSTINISSQCNIQIRSKDGQFSNNLQFLIIKQITSNIPQFSFDPSCLDIPDEIELADPEYNISQKIEVLLGASIFFDLIVKGQIKLGRNKPILQRTRLGWIISGSLQIKNPEAHPSCMLSVNNLLNEQLEKFWSIENVTQTKTQFSDEELECESHFRQNYFRDHEGRFVVKLPLKESYKNLGESLNAAISRLESVERKLSKDINLRNQYEEFLNEYEQLGHMSKIDISLDDPNDIKFYLPHHSVIKENSSTTRLRVVFDGSSKTSTNLSLNDVLRVGPTIQNDLVCVLLRMRIPRFVATADISKMYRMVKVHPENRNLQRIVWRSNPSKAIEHFQLNTVTYGTSSASFLATRSLHQVGLDCQAEFPNISDIIINNFYVDDVIFGSDTLSDLIQLKYELSNILQQAGFLLRKWVSNDHRIFENKTDQCSSTIFEIRDSKERKTLGITWNSQQDRFEYSVILNSQCNPTKRTILSAISQIFDPLGLISPVVVNAKIILKELWQAQCDWDAPIPQNILKR
ncbi:uncharacterized protein [Leptinotarsa decemlineata]|uniref:uncharacterized protein n=1 Tax=Leptinotarsa decemlineata TaxID=7539 RepID=UPI003D30D7C1